MTPEPKEALTDEPQAMVEETDEPKNETPAVEEQAPEHSQDTENLSEAAEADTEVIEADDANLEVAEALDEEQDAGQEELDTPLDEADDTVEVEPSAEVTAEEAADGSEEESEAAEPEPPADDDSEVEPEEQAEMGPEQAPTVESVIEAVLFASDEPLTDSRIANIVETTGKQVRQSIEDLNRHYDSGNHAFRIEPIAGGYQMLTLSSYNGWLKKMLRARGDTKLSPAALETLAIVAYKQPIIRADIEAIRGVAVGEVIRSLMYKGLVKIVGRAEVLGRPMLYGTTKKFLEVFGLNSLKDLPKVEELKNPDR